MKGTMQIESSSSSVGLHENLLGQVPASSWHRGRQGSYFCMFLSGLVFLLRLCFGLRLTNTHRSLHLLKKPHAILLKQQMKVSLVIALFNLTENVKPGNNKGLTVLRAGQLAFAYYSKQLEAFRVAVYIKPEPLGNAASGHTPLVHPPCRVAEIHVVVVSIGNLSCANLHVICISSLPSHTQTQVERLCQIFSNSRVL